MKPIFMTSGPDMFSSSFSAEHRIVLAHAAADDGIEHLRRGGRRGQHEAQAMRLFHDDAQVLLVHPGLEAGLEVALEHALAVVLEDLRVGKTAEQRLAHLGRIDAALRREVEGFGHRHHADTGEDLVAGLGHLAGAGVADQRHRLAHFFEQRP